MPFGWAATILRTKRDTTTKSAIRKFNLAGSHDASPRSYLAHLLEGRYARLRALWRWADRRSVREGELLLPHNRCVKSQIANGRFGIRNPQKRGHVGMVRALRALDRAESVEMSLMIPRSALFYGGHLKCRHGEPAKAEGHEGEKETPHRDASLWSSVSPRSCARMSGREGQASGTSELRRPILSRGANLNISWRSTLRTTSTRLVTPTLLQRYL